MEEPKKPLCRFGIHHLKREFVGDDSTEFAQHFYKCRRCPYQGTARLVRETLDHPSFMTRLFGQVEY
jgi:hypothetical protein